MGQERNLCALFLEAHVQPDFFEVIIGLGQRYFLWGLSLAWKLAEPRNEEGFVSGMGTLSVRSSSCSIGGFTQPTRAFTMPRRRKCHLLLQMFRVSKGLIFPIPVSGSVQHHVLAWGNDDE